MEMNRRRWNAALAAGVAGVVLSFAAAPAPVAAGSAEAEASLIEAARAGDGAAVEACSPARSTSTRPRRAA